MPNYEFKDNETDEVFEALMSISDKEEFLKDNPHVTQLLTGMNIVAGVGGIRNDEGWNENLQRIAEAHPASALAQRYGKKDAKTVNTRNAVEKWKKATGRD
jgi:hypothetical protein